MNALFRETLNREELLGLPLRQHTAPVNIAVYRNHSFELISPVLDVFLNFSGIKGEFWYSGYDDSFSFSELAPQADVCILWVDLTRIHAPDPAAWLTERIRFLHGRQQCAVLAVCCGLPEQVSFPPLPGALFLNADTRLVRLGAQAFDARLQEFTGTRLSGQGILHMAQEMGLRCLPALLRPALKALVLDLDNTLYAGVLGEDGAENLRAYTELQNYLVQLHDQGFLLALASKNEEADVRELLALRQDFPLQWEHFSAWEISWGSKERSIMRIAEHLHISADAMLFIDDNPGEILHARRAIPELHTLEAATPEETLAALRTYPGLLRIGMTHEDHVRGRDLLANRTREKLHAVLDPEEYFRELAMELTFDLHPARHSPRIAELLNKTNQFILTYKRWNALQVEAFFASPATCAVTVALRDRLSDSGIIAVALCQKLDGELHLVELAVSCRALGRGMENFMLAQVLHFAGKRLQCPNGANIHFVKGPRNAPALAWLAAFTGQPVAAEQGIIRLTAIPSFAPQGIRVHIVEEAPS